MLSTRNDGMLESWIKTHNFRVRIGAFGINNHNFFQCDAKKTQYSIVPAFSRWKRDERSELI
jgi:hypothetical protein